MPDGPGDHVTIAVQIAFAAGVGAQDFGDVARDRGFLGQNRHCSGFAGGFVQRESLKSYFSGDAAAGHPP